MSLLLAAAVLLLQDPSADEAFRKIEDAVEKTKSLRVKFKVDVVQKRGPAELSFTLQGIASLRDGNRFHFTAHTQAAQMEEDYLAVCDGTTILQQSGKTGAARRAAPAALVSSFKSVTVRGGSFLAFAKSLRPDAKPEDPKKEYELLNLKHGEDDRDARVLVYGLHFPEADLDVTLRYNARTFIPLSRSLTVRQKGVDAGSIRETYDEFALDPEFPDALFRLPDDGVDPKIARAKTDLAVLQASLAAYEIDNGSYPGSLEALLKEPPGAKAWRGPYIKANDLPKDPWGNAYGYRFPGKRNESGYDLSSNGPDGKPGTADDIFR